MKNLARTISKENLKLETLEPICHLGPEFRDELIAAAQVLQCDPGCILFHEKQDDPYDYFLIVGKLHLFSNNKRIKELEQKTGLPLLRVDARRPHHFTGKCVAPTLVIKWKRSYAESLVNAKSGGTPEMDVHEIDLAETDNWMVRMLKTSAFANVPSANLQKIFMCMESLSVKAGETIITQGEPGDYYYIIQVGRCEVTRTPARGSTPIKLAELGMGDSFGEEALISGKSRNANVRMLTDGKLMRLKKQDFAELIQDPLLRTVDRKQAEAMAKHGAIWLDSRSPNAFTKYAIPDSVSMETCTLRMLSHKLDKSKSYIVCSDSELEAALGAFLLANHGFDVCYLSMTIAEYLGIAAGTPSAADKQNPAVNQRPLAKAPINGGLDSVSAKPRQSAPDAPAQNACAGKFDELTRQMESRIKAEITSQFERERKKFEEKLREELERCKQYAEQQINEKASELERHFKNQYVQKVTAGQN